jgi:hypothetical protein
MTQITTESNRNCNYQTIVNRKIGLATAGLQSFIFKDITQNISPENALIVEYVLAMKIEINISDSYRAYTIQTLSLFSRFSKNKPFTLMRREDILFYLDSSRKDGTLDPLHNGLELIISEELF